MASPNDAWSARERSDRAEPDFSAWGRHEGSSAWPTRKAPEPRARKPLARPARRPSLTQSRRSPRAWVVASALWSFAAAVSVEPLIAPQADRAVTAGMAWLAGH